MIVGTGMLEYMAIGTRLVAPSNGAKKKLTNAVIRTKTGRRSVLSPGQQGLRPLGLNRSSCSLLFAGKQQAIAGGHMRTLPRA